MKLLTKMYSKYLGHIAVFLKKTKQKKQTLWTVSDVPINNHINLLNMDTMH